MKLSDLADIRSGLILSRKMAHEKTAYTYPLLNLKSINSDATINKQTLDVFNASEQLNQEYLTQSSDIVVRMSTPYTAILINKDTKGMVVSSNFVIIRCKTEEILPDYLFWYLNTEDIKKDILKNSARNMLAAIRPQYFSGLELQLPSLKQQRLIADINLTAREEIKLLKKLQNQKIKYYQKCLDNTYQLLINKRRISDDH